MKASHLFQSKSVAFFNLLGGVLIWNIAEGYEHFSKDFADYDKIIDDLRASKQWSYHCPVLKFDNMVFTDCGAAFLKGYLGSGVADKGLVYIMKKS